MGLRNNLVFSAVCSIVGAVIIVAAIGWASLIGDAWQAFTRRSATDLHTGQVVKFALTGRKGQIISVACGRTKCVFVARDEFSNEHTYQRFELEAL